MEKVKVSEKVSKFEMNLIKKMDEKEDKNKIAELAFRRASNIIAQQIAALEIERVNLEIQSEEKQMALDNATYSAEFSIQKYDAAKAAFERVQENLADVEATIKARKELLETWK